jgi:hypothetical protein
MHKSATKCNETIGKWCKNKHGASKIIDTFEMYQYPHYQKLAYAIYMMGKKLPHYFECHSIIVVASTPVSSILNNPDATGHVTL